MMSRPVAGTRNKTMIITLPGSPKGAKENLEAVIKLLPHACIQASGANSRMLHAGGMKKLEKEAGVEGGLQAKVPHTQAGGHSHDHHHHHHHGHGHGHGGHAVPRAHTKPEDRPQTNDPSAGPTNRHRSSPFPMLSVDDALTLISRFTPQSNVVEAPVDFSLIGSVIAKDIIAEEAVPAYRASIVDGYAVIVPNTKGVFPVASVSHAQASSMPPPLEVGKIARITTGAPLPDNANAVVMVEDTVLASSTSDSSEESTVEILTNDVKIGENIREPGSDVAKGNVVLSKGTIVTSVGGELGLLASIGRASVPVYRKPVVGVLSTGDELLPHTAPGPLYGGQVRDSNRPSLLTALQGHNIPTVDLGIAKDTPADALETSIRDAFRSGVDVLITTGGVSMGELDLLKPTIERKLGGTIHFGRVAMKPGKPTTFATVPFKPAASESGDASTQSERSDKLIFSLPGNPASALVTLNLFVLPSLRQSLGYRPGDYNLPTVSVQLAHPMRLDVQRIEYHRVVVSQSSEFGTGLVATSTGGQRSSRVGSLAAANALVVLPKGERGVKENLEKGEVVKALMMGPLVV